jgi:tetratricopeptide (TPR) repeat protein
MIFRLVIPIVLIFLSELKCQDFSVYKKLLDEGKIVEVQKSLPYLTSQYPDHPFVLYLNAAVKNNAEEAIEQFKAIIKDYPDSVAGELAIMKIGEYLYSKGLYTQASEQLRIIPLNYPHSKNIERAVKLMKKSYLATGEQDSIDFYIELFSKKYPQLNFDDYDYYSAVITQEEKPATEEILIDSMEVEEPEPVQRQVKFGEKPWVVQVGAFREKKNAEVIIKRLESAGYSIELIENSDAVNLYLIQIVRFTTIEEAINIGEEVSDKFGLEFHILERN